MSLNLKVESPQWFIQAASLVSKERSILKILKF